MSGGKDCCVIEWANHGGTSCTACDSTPVPYAIATKSPFDPIQRWMDAQC